jgi:hypothetical protein
MTLQQLASSAGRLLRAPWPLIAREAWLTRSAKAGDLTLRVMDLRGKNTRHPNALTAVVRDALERLSAARQGFGELVTSHLHTIVAVDERTRAIWVKERVFASQFRGPEQNSGHYLACQLIWTATAIRLTRDWRAAGRSLDRVHVRQACWEAQKRFLEQFNDAEVWIRHMDPDNHSTDARPDSGAA